MPKPTLTEIAQRIAAYLRRFENDPSVNARDKNDLAPYYQAHAWRAGAYVGIRYISFQPVTFLPKADAARYLKALDSGFVGKHWRLPADA